MGKTRMEQALRLSECKGVMSQCCCALPHCVVSNSREIPTGLQSRWKILRLNVWELFCNISADYYSFCELTWKVTFARKASYFWTPAFLLINTNHLCVNYKQQPKNIQMFKNGSAFFRVLRKNRLRVNTAMKWKTWCLKQAPPIKLYVQADFLNYWDSHSFEGRCTFSHLWCIWLKRYEAISVLEAKK